MKRRPRQFIQNRIGKRISEIARHTAKIILSLICLGLHSSLVQLNAQETQSQSSLSSGAQSAGSDREKLQEQFDQMDLETQRYLVYLYARVNDPAMAESLAQEILSVYPADKRTLLVLCSMYVEQGDTVKTFRTARTLLEFYPNDDQALYFLGAAHFQAGQFRESNQVLREIKTYQYPTGIYPYETDLASAAYKSGDWYKAMLSYIELLRNHSLDDPLRLQVREVLEGLYYEHLPRLDITWESNSLNEGSIRRWTSFYGMHIEDKQWIEAHVRFDDLEINPDPFIASEGSTRTEAFIIWDTQLSSLWETRAWGGGSESGLMGGAGVTRHFSENDNLSLELTGNERATEGLLFETLDGRQNRLSLKGNWRLRRDYFLNWELGAREHRIDGRTLATGGGGQLQLSKLITVKTPELRVGYRMQWLRYEQETNDPSLISSVMAPGTSASTRTAILDGLVRKENHRHGIYGSYVTKRTGAWIFKAGSGVDYVFDLDSIEYYGNVGLVFYPRKSIECRADVFYSTSANTADSTSDLWQIRLGLRYYF